MYNKHRAKPHQGSQKNIAFGKNPIQDCRFQYRRQNSLSQSQKVLNLEFLDCKRD